MELSTVVVSTVLFFYGVYVLIGLYAAVELFWLNDEFGDLREEFQGIRGFSDALEFVVSSAFVLLIGSFILLWSGAFIFLYTREDAERLRWHRDYRKRHALAHC